MIELIRTNSDNEYFQYLVSGLDKDLAIRNGENNYFFAQYNKTDQIKHVIVAFLIDQPVGCGAMKEFDDQTMEIKRMFVPVQMRGKGIASAILQGLEKWAEELGYNKCILETGDKMPEAIRLYQKRNYRIMPNYGQYKNVHSSICFQKEL
jgi:GNAT superfamily N-acetyltransferase